MNVAASQLFGAPKDSNTTILICIEVQEFKKQSIFYDTIIAVNWKYNLLEEKDQNGSFFPPCLKV